MQGMMDLGRFGDERLQKGGPIFLAALMGKADGVFASAWRRSSQHGALPAFSAQSFCDARDHAFDRRRPYGAGGA